MAKFLLKPFEAIQFTGANWAEVTEFCGTHDVGGTVSINTFAVIGTNATSLDPTVVAELWDSGANAWIGVRANDWIIKAARGEFYPSPPEEFEDSYTQVAH